MMTPEPRGRGVGLSPPLRTKIKPTASTARRTRSRATGGKGALRRGAFGTACLWPNVDDASKRMAKAASATTPRNFAGQVSIRKGGSEEEAGSGRQEAGTI